jgi:hypothetical protein
VASAHNPILANRTAYQGSAALRSCHAAHAPCRQEFEKLFVFKGHAARVHVSIESSGSSSLNNTFNPFVGDMVMPNPVVLISHMGFYFNGYAASSSSRGRMLLADTYKNLTNCPDTKTYKETSSKVTDACPDGYEKNGALCYPKCADGGFDLTMHAGLTAPSRSTVAAHL